ncbi:MAG: DinB family protein [Propionibacteriaceae bacterium]
MPGNPPPVKTEREALIVYLVQQRDGLTYAAYGLTEEQIRLRPTRSQLTVGGLIKHAASTERGWTDILLERPSEGDEQAYEDDFQVADGETLAGLIATFDEVAAETERAIRGLDSLDVTFQLPDAPWYPSNPDGYSARWIVLHIIEELARHAGHADILREPIDGATMYELMAGAEGWPETDWIKPWKPAGETVSA